MMTPRENAMAIFNREQPDYYGDIMAAVTLLPDPVLMGGGVPQDGLPHKNMWGVEYRFMPGAPGPHPHITDDNKVISDIEKWESQLNVPSLDGLNWGPAIEVEKTVDRKEKMVCIMFGGGLFEMSHFLMGMEDALCNYLDYPDEMKALLNGILLYCRLQHLVSTTCRLVGHSYHTNNVITALNQ